MRLAEIQSKDDFHKKLKYDMKAVNSITSEVERIIGMNNSAKWMQADYEQKFGDDYVEWIVTVNFQSEHVGANDIAEIYKSLEPLYANYNVPRSRRCTRKILKGETRQLSQEKEQNLARLRLLARFPSSS
jgi:hypothetical protein